MTKRKRKRRRARKQRQQTSSQTIDWQLPYPPLAPEDRMSAIMNYAEFVPGYDEFVAEMGKQAFEEQMDYFYFFLGNSDRLIDEPEFQDVELGIDPYDFVVFAAHDFLTDMAAEKGDIWSPEGGLVPPYDHIVQHAISRYLTPTLQADLKRRTRRTAHRCRGTGIGSMANAVKIELDDEGPPSTIVTLLPTLFSNALIQSVLDTAKQHERDWEERDRSLDRWMEQITAADFDQPAEQAIEKLAAAGQRAMPHIAHLFYGLELEYDEYPVITALELAARIPCQLSLRFLTQTLFDSGDWPADRAAELLSNMPDLACPYLTYALTVPGGPKWQVALQGYMLLGKLECPGTFDVLVDGLSYLGHSPHDPEVGQLSAAEGLLALGDEQAIPTLHDYLRNPQASLEARSELLYMLLEHDGGHPWGTQIAGDLTLDTLPSSE